MNEGKRAAEVVRIEPYRPPVVRQSVALTGRTAKIVLADLRERTRRGEVESAGQLQLIPSGPLAGQYAVRVVMIAQPRQPSAAPRWLLGIGAALVGVAAVVGAFAWLMAAMSAASLAGLCVILLAVLGVAAAAGRKPKAGSVTVISNINVGR